MRALRQALSKAGTAAACLTGDCRASGGANSALPPGLAQRAGDYAMDPAIGARDGVPAELGLRAGCGAADRGRRAAYRHPMAGRKLPALLFRIVSDGGC